MFTEPSKTPSVETMMSMERRISELTAYVQCLEERVHQLDQNSPIKVATTSGFAFIVTDSENQFRQKEEYFFILL